MERVFRFTISSRGNNGGNRVEYMSATDRAIKLLYSITLSQSRINMPKYASRVVFFFCVCLASSRFARGHVFWDQRREQSSHFLMKRSRFLVNVSGDL